MIHRATALCAECVFTRTPFSVDMEFAVDVAAAALLLHWVGPKVIELFYSASIDPVPPTVIAARLHWQVEQLVSAEITPLQRHCVTPAPLRVPGFPVGTGRHCHCSCVCWRLMVVAACCGAVRYLGELCLPSPPSSSSTHTRLCRPSWCLLCTFWGPAVTAPALCHCMPFRSFAVPVPSPFVCGWVSACQRCAGGWPHTPLLWQPVSPLGLP